MERKRVLIISYYWPPSGGAGVQRWLKFVKYLPESGWLPVVYTPSNGEMPVIDTSLEKDVPAEAIIIRRPIWEPYHLYKKFVGKKKDEKINTGFLNEGKGSGLTEKISVWLRGNLFIPDARKFWITPSIKFLSDYLGKNKIDAIVSTGPPHSMHLIALGLKKRFNIPWLADFRDPWTNIDFYHDLMLSKSADRKHHRLEKEVLLNASAVVSIGKTMAQEFEAIAHRKVDVITNGYDNDDMPKEVTEKDNKFSIAHIGTMVKTRNPITLWKVLKQLIDDKKFAANLEIKLVGKIDFAVRKSLEESGLMPFTNFIDYLNHDEVIKVQVQSQVLLLMLNSTKNAKGILTGKFFEYMTSGRPILCIGREDGDAAEIISETNIGIVCNHDDEVKTTKAVLDYYNSYLGGKLAVQSKDIDRYSRKALTKQLVTLLERITT